MDDHKPRNLLGSAKPELGSHANQRVKHLQQIRLQLGSHRRALRIDQCGDVRIGLGARDKSRSKARSLRCQPVQVNARRVVQEGTHLRRRRPKLNHIDPVQHLGAEHVGGLIHIHRADDEQVVGQSHTAGHLDPTRATDTASLQTSLHAVQRQRRIAGFHRRQKVGKVALHMREIHLVEDQKVRVGCVRVCTKNQLQRAVDWWPVHPCLQRIRIPQQVLVAGPVRTHGNDAVLRGRRTQPHGKGFCDFGFAGTG